VKPTRTARLPSQDVVADRIIFTDLERAVFDLRQDPDLGSALQAAGRLDVGKLFIQEGLEPLEGLRVL
jgi:hypothetical protein